MSVEQLTTAIASDLATISLLIQVYNLAAAAPLVQAQIVQYGATITARLKANSAALHELVSSLAAQ